MQEFVKPEYRKFGFGVFHSRPVAIALVVAGKQRDILEALKKTTGKDFSVFRRKPAL